MKKPRDYSKFVGRRFGRWEIQFILPERNKKGHVLARCKCTCGTVKDVLFDSVRYGQSTGCRCHHASMPWRRLRPYESLYNRFVVRNSNYGHGRDPISIEISYDDFLKFTRITECHYCGDTVAWSRHNIAKKYKGYNLDRKENSEGYTKDNVVVCCAACNRGKGGSFTYDEWVCMTQALREFRKRKAIGHNA